MVGNEAPMTGWGGTPESERSERGVPPHPVNSANRFFKGTPLLSWGCAPPLGNTGGTGKLDAEGVPETTKPRKYEALKGG